MLLATNNDLLRHLQPDSATRIRSHLCRVRLIKNSVLTITDQPLGYVYFVESGLASLTWPAVPSGIDIALVGNEGLLGSGPSLNDERQLFGTVARTDIIALQMRADDFIKDLADMPEFSGQVGQYLRTLWRQVAECAYSNARASVEQRLARWIIMASARLGSDTVVATHDALAAAIGCRRAGVTVALHLLEGEQALKSRRGKLVVTNLDRLHGRAAGAAPAPIEAIRSTSHGTPLSARN